LRGLYDDERQHLRRVAAMLIFGAAAVLLPINHISWVALAEEQVVPREEPVPALPAPPSLPSFVLRRDPFQGGAVLGAQSMPDSFRETSIQQSELNAEIVLPANDGASDLPLPPGQPPDMGLTVRAVALGPRPHALIDVLGLVRVLGIGDSISGRRLREIDGKGVTLSDGLRITFGGAK
jgi:hypothetical protein